jgi:hypothetical protein
MPNITDRKELVADLESKALDFGVMLEDGDPSYQQLALLKRDEDTGEFSFDVCLRERRDARNVIGGSLPGEEVAQVAIGLPADGWLLSQARGEVRCTLGLNFGDDIPEGLSGEADKSAWEAHVADNVSGWVVEAIDTYNSIEDAAFGCDIYEDEAVAA